MIVRELVPVPTSSRSGDPTIETTDALVVKDEGAAMMGVQLKLPDVTITITQDRDTDGVWAFYVATSEEDVIERFGPAMDQAADA